MHHSPQLKPIVFMALWSVTSFILLNPLCDSTVAAESLQAETVEIAADEVVATDLFITAGVATISGKVEGDLFIIANEVRISGEIGGSTYLLARTTQVSGTMQGTVRWAGDSISLLENASLARDLFALGNSVSTEPQTQITGSLNVAARSLDLQGDVVQEARLAGDDVKLVGRFESDVSLAIASVSGLTGTDSETGLTIGENTNFGGDLTIQTESEPTLPTNLQVAGETTIIPWGSAGPTSKSPGEAYLHQTLLIWGQLLLVGFGFRIVLPGRTKQYLNNLHRLPIPAVLLGPCYWLLVMAGGALAIAATVALSIGLSFVELWDVMPLVCFIGFVAVITFWGGGTLLGLILSPVLTGVWFCRTVLSWLPGFGREAYLLPVIAGTAGVAAAAAIPQYGFIVWLVTASFGSGAYLIRAESEPPPAGRYRPTIRSPKNRIT